MNAVIEFALDPSRFKRCLGKSVRAMEFHLFKIRYSSKSVYLSVVDPLDGFLSISTPASVHLLELPIIHTVCS